MSSDSQILHKNALKVGRQKGKNHDDAKRSSAGNDRQKNDRRKQIDPTTCERDYDDAEVEFMKAMDDYKRKSGRQFPTWSEVLEVFLALGYRKIAEPTDIDHAKRHDP